MVVCLRASYQCLIAEVWSVCTAGWLMTAFHQVLPQSEAWFSSSGLQTMLAVGNTEADEQAEKRGEEKNDVHFDTLTA